MRQRRMAVALIAALSSAALVAQNTAPEAASQEKPGMSAAPSSGPVTLRVTVVISRYQADKKVGSLPYTFGVLGGERTNLRMGSDVPIISTPPTLKSGDTPPSPTVNYRGVGTNIDCQTSLGPGGTFRLNLTIEDSSVHLDQAQKAGSAALLSGYPSFRTFRTNFATLLRDGQTTQHTSATDPVTGEVMRVDVSLTVLK
jgi:hypothetical protein